MINYFVIIFCIVAVIIIFSFNGLVSLNKNYFKYKSRLKLIFLILTISILSSVFYLKLSNFWIGKSILERVSFKTNILNKEANEIAVINQLMNKLNEKIIRDPKNLEIILQLAETNFLLGNLYEALNLYRKARQISPESIQIMKAEIQVRVLLEKNKLSEETIYLLNNILRIEPQNLLSLYVLGNYAYDII